MPHRWKATNLTSPAQVFEVLLDLAGKGWLCRGQRRHYPTLLPDIDRKLAPLSRAEKLALERQSIELYRSTARFLADGEEGAFRSDVIALMVLRHHGVPSRLLDWTMSPDIAAYFATEPGRDTEDGEIWAFDRPFYQEEGKKQ